MTLPIYSIILMWRSATDVITLFDLLVIFSEYVHWKKVLLFHGSGNMEDIVIAKFLAT